MHVHGATNLLPPVEESVEDRGGGGGGGTMDRHGKHRDNVYCAFESWLRSRGGLRGGLYRARRYNGKILGWMEFGWLFSGLEEIGNRIDES